MRRLFHPSRSPGSAGALAFLVLSGGAAGARTYSPYQTDVFTLHLWHLDESATPAADAVAGSGNLPLRGLSGGASLGETGAPGFGSALLANSVGILLAATALANGSGDNVAFSHANSSGGAFTFEALVRTGAPAVLNGTTGQPMEILSMEGDGSADRAFQFRIVGRTAAAGPKLEFANLRTGTGAQAAISVPLPVSGPHVPNTTDWFHVAVAYSGADNTAGNLRFHWTDLQSGATRAVLLGTATMTADLQNVAADLAIGNEARGTGGQTEGFGGAIDEVRISGVARAPDQFLFSPVPAIIPTITGSGPAADTWEAANPPSNTLDGNPATRAASGVDGASITYSLGPGSCRLRSLDMAFHNGNARIYTFDVRVSEDGQTWNAALTEARSTGLSNNPEHFVLPECPPVRFVRIVGHGNTVNAFNSWTEVAFNGFPPADADGDGLPDAWEAWIADASAGDAITGIADIPSDGDFDGDGLSNSAEFGYGTDPVLSDSGDSDGDGLEDLWEWLHLGGLGSGAYDDPDGDGKSNLMEAVANTDPEDGASRPSWNAPLVALLRDTPVAGDACLMPSGTYGQAINGISFQDQILLTFGGYQYTAWYDTSGSVQRICHGRRTVNATATGPWEICKSNSEFLNGDESAWDAHNVVAIGICPNDGTLHIAWDSHGNTLRYRRSVAGLCTTNQSAWITGELGSGNSMLLAEQNWLAATGSAGTSVTYPQFAAAPDGDLILNRRSGASGNGDQTVQRYTGETGWSPAVQFINRAGTYNGPDYSGNATTSTARCAYVNGLDYGPDGRIHVTWTWRENAGGSNHDICYAFSDDHGVTWKNNSGSVVADTATGGWMDLNTPGLTVRPLDMRQLLINQQAQCVDADGRVHVLMMHRRQDPGYGPEVFKDDFSTKFTAYYHYFRDPAGGMWFQRRIPPEAAYPGSHPKIGYDAAGNLYAAFLSYAEGTAVTPGYSHGKLVIAAASKVSSFSDWEVLYRGTTEFNGEPIIDAARLLADGILSVYVQEHSDAVSSNGIPTPLHVMDFAVNVPEPVATTPSLAFFGGDAVVCLRGAPGTTYQLQTSTDPAGTWSDTGAPAAGSGAMLAFPHAGRAPDPRRFYRIVRTPAT